MIGRHVHTTQFLVTSIQLPRPNAKQRRKMRIHNRGSNPRILTRSPKTANQSAGWDLLLWTCLVDTIPISEAQYVTWRVRDDVMKQIAYSPTLGCRMMATSLKAWVFWSVDTTPTNLSSVFLLTEDPKGRRYATLEPSSAIVRQLSPGLSTKIHHLVRPRLQRHEDLVLASNLQLCQE